MFGGGARHSALIPILSSVFSIICTFYVMIATRRDRGVTRREGEERVNGEDCVQSYPPPPICLPVSQGVQSVQQL